MNANPHFPTSERIGAGGGRDKNGDYPTNISLPTWKSTPRARDVEATEIKTSGRGLSTLQSSRSPQTPLIPHPPMARNYAVSNVVSSTERNATHNRRVSSQDAAPVQSELTDLTGFLHNDKQESSVRNTTKSKQALSEQLAIITTPTTRKSAKQNRSVSFDKVSIRSYERILTVNPSCTSGPPLGLGWRFVPERHFQIDKFENCRLGNRRTTQQLVLPRKVRERWLQELGYDQREVVKAVRLTIRYKHQRW